MKFLGSLMLKNFGSHLSWKLSWTPSHKWSPLFQWTWTRLNFPLQKGLPQCTAGRETWFTGATLIEIGVYFEVYSVETKSTVSIHSTLFTGLSIHWTLLCLARTRFYLSFVRLWKNTSNDKERRQDDRVQVCLLSYLLKELLIFS